MGYVSKSLKSTEISNTPTERNNMQPLKEWVELQNKWVIKIRRLGMVKVGRRTRGWMRQVSAMAGGCGSYGPWGETNGLGRRANLILLLTAFTVMQFTDHIVQPFKVCNSSFSGVFRAV